MIIKEMLKETGVCFIAAKKCYFGVGGSTQSFIEYLQKENLLNVETCWSLNEGSLFIIFVIFDLEF